MKKLKFYELTKEAKMERLYFQINLSIYLFLAYSGFFIFGFILNSISSILLGSTSMIIFCLFIVFDKFKYEILRGDFD